MATTLANIIAGPLTVYEGPLGESLPDMDDIAPPGITITPGGNWVASGSTQEEFHLIYTPTFESVQINEVTAPVTAFETSAEAEFSYVQAEDDITAWERTIASSTKSTVAAGADQTAQDLLKVGTESSTVTLISLCITGLNPEGGTRLIHGYRALATGPSDWARARGHMGRTCTYSLYADPAGATGQNLFKVYDITAQASS